MQCINLGTKRNGIKLEYYPQHDELSVTIFDNKNYDDFTLTPKSDKNDGEFLAAVKNIQVTNKAYWNFYSGDCELSLEIDLTAPRVAAFSERYEFGSDSSETYMSALHLTDKDVKRLLKWIDTLKEN